MDAQRLQFAQQKKSEDVIKVDIGERYAGYRRLTQTLERMQLGCSLDLRSQVRRCAQ